MQLSLKEQHSTPSKSPRPTTQPLHNYGFHPRLPTEEIELE
jgi:Leucine rich repeat